jgi:hypothetical protein
VKLLLRLCAIVMVVVCATWAYRVNYATQEAMNRVADLEDAIAAEREALAVLNAEWAYLNRPDRLRALVAENAEVLGLVELTPDHFGDVAMVAYPPEPEAPEDGDAAIADAGEAAGESAAEKPTATAAPPRPVVRTASAAAQRAAPKREAAAARESARPRQPLTLQDLVNAVAGKKP